MVFPASRNGAAGPLLAIRGLSKRFSGTLALDDVDIDLNAGEVHALLGENGAGKSTLIKILAGVYRPDRGEFFANGRQAPGLGRELLISFVHQDLGLVDSMSVEENISLVAGYPRRRALISWTAARSRAARLLSVLGSGLDPERPISELSSADKSIVALARALSLQAELLVLDEPTATLPEADVARLFEVLSSLKRRGIGIVYVTHRLDEVFRVADRVTVLRNGRRVHHSAVADTTPSELVVKIVGRELSQVFVQPPPPSATEVLRADELRVEGWVGPVSFSLRSGEVVGLSGLRGAGHDLVGRGIFGDRRVSGGRIIIDGRSHARTDIDRMMAAGVGFLSSKRAEESLAHGLSARENIYLNPLGAGDGPLSVIRPAAERARCAEAMRRFLVRPAEPERPIDTFSGGNQQKIVIARWFERGYRVLILEEPTIGVDVGSKAEIYAMMNVALRNGKAILLISSDFEEVAYLCHRVLVFDRGKPVAEIPREALTVESVTRAASGFDSGPRKGWATE